MSVAHVRMYYLYINGLDPNDHGSEFFTTGESTGATQTTGGVTVFY